jgi:hypothetical protein
VSSPSDWFLNLCFSVLYSTVGFRIHSASLRSALLSLQSAGPLLCLVESESYVTTDRQSASLPWNKAPIWSLRPDFYYCQDSCGFVYVGRFLRREDGSVLYNCCWHSPAQSFSVLSPVGKAFDPACTRESAWLSLSLMLRPTVGRPVCLGIKHPSGAYDQNFNTVWQLRICWFGTPSLTRGWVCRLQLLLALARQRDKRE